MQTRVQQLWQSLHRPLVNYTFKQVKDKEIAHDIVQEVFLKLMTHAHTITHVSNLKSYLYTTTKNSIIDYFRTHKNEELKEIKEEEDTKSEFQLADCCLRPMIEDLPAIYRDALIMVELEGMSQKEYTEKINLSYSAAKSRVQRARQLLKVTLIACCNYQFDKYGNIIDCCNSN